MAEIEKKALLPTEGERVDLESAGAAPKEEVASARLFIAAAVCCFSPLLFGFSMGFTSPVQSSMEGDVLGVRHPSGPPPDLSIFSPSGLTMYAALLNIGAVPGAFAGSKSMELLGRKGALALSAVPHFAAWGLTVVATSPWLLYACRVMTGFGVGIGSAAAPCYISEISPPSLRGPLGVAFQMGICLGLVLVNIVGDYGYVVEEYHHHLFGNWRRLSVWGVALSGFLGLMLFMPESPKWLARQGRGEDAQLALRMLRTGEAPEAEAELRKLAHIARAEAKRKAGLEEEELMMYQPSLRSKSLLDYKPSIIVAVGCLVFQQFSGINAIMMYATAICSQAGIDNAQVAALVIMAAQLVLTAASSALIEKTGRRCLMQAGGLLACASHLGMAYYMIAVKHGLWGPSWMPLASLGVFMLGFSTGMGPIPWVLIGEVFPAKVVGSASAIATAVMWSCSFSVCVGFRGLQLVLGQSGVFLLFGGLCFACFVFVTVLVPETKGKTVDEVLLALNVRRKC